ncbi:shikimate kinase AroK [Lentisalinibacter orientalis]|uniref:shikimate kinase AroK n=1 Tax=Lentisalinibacter orientalis TaxID=2992241 RepID=UPI00386F4A05
MSDGTRIFLVGPMGAGKSAVGRALARALKLEFVDTDDEIERRTGVDIPFIFEKEGEAGFRKREAAVVDELTARPDLVLATGGGVVGDPDNRRHLAARGTVVYLHTTVAQQLARTRRGRERPMLAAGDPEETLGRLFAERDPLYREIADLVIETDGRRVHHVVEDIRSRL